MPVDTRNRKIEVASQRVIDAIEMADKSTEDKEQKSQHQKSPSIRAENKSKMSSKNSEVRMKQLEAQLKADEELARLLSQEEDLLMRRKIEHERRMIENRLTLEKARLEGTYREESGESGKNLPGVLEIDGAREKVKNWLFENNSVISSVYRDSFVGDPNLNEFSDKIDQREFQDNVKPDVSVTRKDLMQFMARQSIQQDLPEFCGEIKEWPNFYQQYVSTTNLLGLSNEENVCRLRKCLKGDAKRAVEALLISNSPVSTIIETLKRRFGRSDLLIKALVTECKSFPNIRSNDSKNIINFAETVTNMVKTFEILKMENYLKCPQLMEDLLQKLPPNLQWQWGEKAAKAIKELFLIDFQSWISDKASAISYIPYLNKSFEGKPEYKNKYRSALVTDMLKPSTSSKLCILCKESHYLKDCKTFVESSIQDRWDFVKKNAICFCCLKKSHRIKECRSKKRCGINKCDKIHNQLLHTETEKHEENLVGHTSEIQSQVFLKIAPVVIKTENNIEKEIFALFDEGSTVTLIDENLASELKLHGDTVNLGLKWTNKDSCRNILSRKVSFDISSRNRQEFYRMRAVYTLKNLDLPIQTLNISKMSSKWTHLRKVDIADLKDAKPRLLIGQDHWDLIATRELVEGPKNSPALSNTRLGWVVHGNVQQFRGRTDNYILHIQQRNSRDDDLDHLVREYFSIESFGVKVSQGKLKSKEDEKAEEIMRKITCKTGSKWETGLLWKDASTKLPDSRPLALQRFKYIEKKMNQDRLFKQTYIDKIREYLQKGYARKLDDFEIETENKIWYLPHFGVINLNKKKPMRLVFDSAAKVQGKSLNDCLFKGPDLYNSLVGIIWRFREKRIAFSADIREMFHQIRIRELDQSAQRFLFREDPKHPISTFQMQVMIFGNISSPYCAQYIKNQNAIDFIDEFPNAVNAILKNHYMDDYLDSVDSEDEAIKIIQEVIDIYRKGGFEMVGWISNSEKVQKNIPKNLCSENSDEANLYHRVLGLKWCPKRDILKFSLNFHKLDEDIMSGKIIPTKRQVLQIVMSIFDPLGLLGNIIIKGKILLQEIWKTGIGWDKKIDSYLNKKWRKWIEKIKFIEGLEIPRCYSKDYSGNFDLELHIFSDSSKQAMATVAYLRLNRNDKVIVALVMSRTQVAKDITIPRLELQAAVMGCRLASSIQQEHTLKIKRTVYWTDSKVVLGWIKSERRKYKTFVANRINEILENSKETQWRWIPTSQNVADEATRSEGLVNLSINSRWFRGPEFLYQREENWPKEELFPDTPQEEIEIDSKMNHILITQSEDQYFPDITRISSWGKALRILAYILRFLNNSRHKNEGLLSGELSVQEIHQSEKIWLKHIQNIYFQVEMKCLKDGKPVPKQSKLHQLTPFLEQGILRVEGRTDNSPELSSETKRPIILPNGHRLIYLLVEHYHKLFGHKGIQMVLNELRQKYWIIGGRRLVAKVIRSCLLCEIRKSKPRVPRMGQLPDFRIIKPLRPFTYVGMDYFGPMEIVMGRKRYKRYGVLFTCLSIRAVHLEIAESLSTDSTILALRRFFSRRGQPLMIWSDNGTNLKCASKELRNALREIDYGKIHRELLAKEIDWRFISPASPHMGGAWERMVRSIKETLRILLKERVVKEEVLFTFLLEAEHIVNSRPLTYVSLNSCDLESLTPNHFLIGSSSIVRPPVVPEYNLKILDMRKQWRYSQKLAENFWQRWVREYLPTLTKRTKWYQEERNIKVDDIVIVMDNTLPRNNWPLGRIVSIYPGKDGKVRVVEVKTKTGTFRRPVAKICPIEFTEMFEEEL